MGDVASIDSETARPKQLFFNNFNAAVQCFCVFGRSSFVLKSEQAHFLLRSLPPQALPALPCQRQNLFLSSGPCARN